MTKKMNKLAATFAVATSALLLSLSAASAAPGTATTNVNMRSGPGTNYAVVGVVTAGQRIEVGNCRSSWCSVSIGRTSGWIAQQYIRTSAPAAKPAPQRPQVQPPQHVQPQRPQVQPPRPVQPPHQVQPPRQAQPAPHPIARPQSPAPRPMDPRPQRF
jgi:hypothetical protein